MDQVLPPEYSPRCPRVQDFSSTSRRHIDSRRVSSNNAIGSVAMVRSPRWASRCPIHHLDTVALADVRAWIDDLIRETQ